MKTKIKLPSWIRTGVILTAIIAGLSMASLTSTAHGHLTDSQEPQELRNCVESGGKFVSDRPMPEGLAKVIVQQCHERIAADSAIRRFEQAHAWPVNLIGHILVLLIDPINLVFTTVFSVISAALLFSLARKVVFRPGAPQGG
jgi:hypothetical protein